MQLRIRQIRQQEAFQQPLNAIDSVDAPGVKANPFAPCFLPGGAALLHGGIGMTLQHHIGLPIGVDQLVHGLGQQHIAGAMPDEKAGDAEILVFCQKLGQIRHDAHAGLPPQSGRQHSSQSSHLVQAIHHHGAVSVQQPQAFEKCAKQQMQPPIRAAETPQIVIMGVPHRLRLQLYDAFRPDRRFRIRVANRIYPGMVRQPFDKKPVVFLRLECWLLLGRAIK